ncbi:MAG: sugar ABC transporter permease [Anaerolineae bacterium]|nr:sugar ABC transporter permease [Anaerolineae bacterium]
MTARIQERPQGAAYPPALLVNIIWNIFVIGGSLLLCYTIFQVTEDFFSLGRPVQLFAGMVALLPAVLAAFATLALLQRRPAGRYAALVINYVVMVMAGFVLLHLWGVFIGLDYISGAILQNVQYTLGLALAYALYWLAGRMREDNPLRLLLERVAIAIGMLSLLLLLWFAGAVNAAFSIISTYANPVVWLVTAIMIFSGLLAYRILHLGEYFGETPQQQAAWQGWLMLSPNVIGFVLFFAGPLLLSFYLSFTNDTVGNVPEIIGLRNYGEILSLQVGSVEVDANPRTALDRDYGVLGDIVIGQTRYVLGARDPLFWQSIRNTIVFCLMLIPLSVIPAIFLSLILNSKLPGMKFYRAIYFLPSVAAVVGTALIWRWLYDPTIGYFNFIITQIVGFLNSTFGVSLTDPRILWLTDQGVVLFSLVLLAGWQVVGFNTVLFLAGLQSIPQQLYEAAYVDGANRWQQFRNVTLPMLSPTTFFVIITTVITGLQVFNEPYALIAARPMPTAATTAVYYLYNRGFFRFEFGYASSVAWVLFALIFVVTLVQFRISRSNKAYEE